MAAKKKANTARKRTSKSGPTKPIEEKTLEQEVRELRADVAHWRKIANAALDSAHPKRASVGSRSPPISKSTLERQAEELRAELAIIKRIAQAVVAGEL